MIGTLGVVTRAKAQGYLPAVKPVVQALLAVQFRVDDALIRAVLQAVGETWP